MYVCMRVCVCVCVCVCALFRTFFRMTGDSDVVNDSPLPLPMWWRPGQGRGPLSWALQALLSILCTRWHIRVRTNCPSAGLICPCGMLSSSLSTYVAVCWHMVCVGSTAELFGYSAIEVVGSGRRRQPYWFLESEQVLSPLLAAKKHAWDQVLSVGSPYTHCRFKQCEWAIKRAVAGAKET